ncbi:MAG: hypothetical protein ACC628_15795 [Pirellulaceae bacterium]
MSHLLLLLLASSGAPPGSLDYFKILVVDEATGRGVPLVELKTVNDIRYYTDSHGVVAFHEPGLMDQRVFFHIASHGYEYPQDAIGYRGCRLVTQPGGKAVLKIHRVNIAERLYRVTGAGVYRDSVLVGDSVPLKKPLLNARVFGSDSVVNTVFKNKIYWFWGDTNRPSYPLGNFHVPGATSLLPEDGGLDPERGVQLCYFEGKQGFAKPTAQMPGRGPTWIGALVTVKDETKPERLFARYVKIKSPLEVYEHGLVEFNDDTKEFEKRVQFDLDAPIAPGGHPVKHRVEGQEYVYFVSPFPSVRVRATGEHLQDLSKYEAFTCLQPGCTEDAPVVDRRPDGTLNYAWKSDAPPMNWRIQSKLVSEKKLHPEELWFQTRDVTTGKPILNHGGSVYWNASRGRWVNIALETFGTSVLGEIWFAEADSLLGPWSYARKIVTHDKYSFYNPKQHPMFDKFNGRVIFFEGTYTAMFSGNEERTPRYNYNQIMYQLDLSDPRLALPVPVYRCSGPQGQVGLATRKSQRWRDGSARVAFYALDRPIQGSVAVRAASGDEDQTGGLQLFTFPDGAAPDCLFYALPVDGEDPPATSAPLYEFVDPQGRREYSTNRDGPFEGFQLQEQPICRVWEDPKNPLESWQ